MRAINDRCPSQAVERVEMNRNQEKKQTEQRVLAAAREAGAPIPTGELAGEEPDFRFLTPNGALGIEVSEVLRPASTNFGISPVEAESFHQAIMLKAHGKYQTTSTAPTRGNVYFSPARGKKQRLWQRHLVPSVFDLGFEKLLPLLHPCAVVLLGGAERLMTEQLANALDAHTR